MNEASGGWRFTPVVEESSQVRWETAKAQAALLRRALAGLVAHQETLTTLLGEYKHLETDIIAPAGIAEDTCYRDMLIERLGLTNWHIIDGGSEPDAA